MCRMILAELSSARLAAIRAPCFAVLRVRETGLNARAGFDNHFKTVLFKRPNVVGDQRDSTLAGGRLFGNADDQRLCITRHWIQFACGIFVLGCGKTRL